MQIATPRKVVTCASLAATLLLLASPRVPLGAAQAVGAESAADADDKANTVFREIMLGYVQQYLKEGNPALPV